MSSTSAMQHCRCPVRAEEELGARALRIPRGAGRRRTRRAARPRADGAAALRPEGDGTAGQTRAVLRLRPPLAALVRGKLGIPTISFDPFYRSIAWGREPRMFAIVSKYFIEI